jgi:hypothetical protein
MQYVRLVHVEESGGDPAIAVTGVTRSVSALMAQREPLRKSRLCEPPLTSVRHPVGVLAEGDSRRLGCPSRRGDRADPVPRSIGLWVLQHLGSSVVSVTPSASRRAPSLRQRRRRDRMRSITGGLWLLA